MNNPVLCSKCHQPYNPKTEEGIWISKGKEMQQVCRFVYHVKCFRYIELANVSYVVDALTREHFPSTEEQFPTLAKSKGEVC